MLYDQIHRRRCLSLALCVATFIIGYSLTGYYAGQTDAQTNLAFAWERHIPFMSWTFIPYWSLDIFYICAFWQCKTKIEIDTHTQRLLFSQFISYCIFILFPCEATHIRPAPETGVSGLLQTAIESFDTPYNQFPSLHVSIAVIVASTYLQSATRLQKIVIVSVSIVIILSTLSTYQHHILDILGGLLLGFFCLWLWPRQGRSPIFREHSFSFQQKRRRRIAGYYFIACAICVVLAQSSPILSPAYWPALSFLLVSWGYYWCGARLFQKHDGQHRFAAKVLLFPYLFCAKINRHLWKTPDFSVVKNTIQIGRLPKHIHTDILIDMTAELAAPRAQHAAQTLHCFASLDLTLPAISDLLAAAQILERAEQAQKSVHIACALGVGRSAAVLISWYVLRQDCADTHAAALQLRSQGVPVSLNLDELTHLQWLLSENRVQWAKSHTTPQQEDKAQSLADIVGDICSGFAAFFSSASLCVLAPMPTEKVVFFSNHQSHADLLLLRALLPTPWQMRLRPIAAQDYWHGNRLRQWFVDRVYRALMIQRLGAHSQDPISTMRRALDSGDHLLIFPEGTRNTQPGLLAFRSGLGRLAVACPDAQFVPVYIDGAKRAWPKGQILPLPLPCSVTIGAALQARTDESAEAFTRRARAGLVQLMDKP